ncbi:VOC family protein [Streptococcus rifensis]
MKLEHFALYVDDLEGARLFFETYFDAISNQLYHNHKTTFKSYFLTFSDGARLEIMTRDDTVDLPKTSTRLGFAHLAFSLGSKEAVDGLTKRLLEDGFKHVSGPRTTGDGYYESCILDAEGNQIELTI